METNPATQSYLDAPATALLAVHCCCCGTALLDALSVETGIGPDCRKKHGFKTAQAEPNWEKFLLATDGLVAVADIVHENESDPVRQRRLANLLVHRIAIELDRDRAVAMQLIGALESLGFEKLAGVLTTRSAKVVITDDGDTYRVKAPYSERSVSILRGVPGRRYDGLAKQNIFPKSAKAELFYALRRAYPGMAAKGPLGLFILEAA